MYKNQNKQIKKKFNWTLYIESHTHIHTHTHIKLNRELSYSNTGWKNVFSEQTWKQWLLQQFWCVVEVSSRQMGQNERRHDHLSSCIYRVILSSTAVFKSGLHHLDLINCLRTDKTQGHRIRDQNRGMQDERIAHSETIMRTPINKAKGEEERKLSIPASPKKTQNHRLCKNNTNMTSLVVQCSC